MHGIALQFPQEDVAGYASYLLSQWQSLLSSSLAMLDMDVGLSTSAAAVVPAASLLQAPLLALGGPPRQSTPCQSSRDWTAQHASPDSAPTTSPAAHAKDRQHHAHTQPPCWPSVQQQTEHMQPAPEPQGFRPWSCSHPTAHEAPAPVCTCLTQAAAMQAMPVSAHCTPAGQSAHPWDALASAARVSGAATQAAQGAGLLHSAAEACSGDAMPPWQCPEPPQVLQSGPGFRLLHQLHGLPGLFPDRSVLQAFDSAFLRQMTFQSSPPMATLLQSPEMDHLVRDPSS